MLGDFEGQAIFCRRRHQAGSDPEAAHMSIGHRPSRGGRNAPGHRWEIALSSIRPASAPGAARLPAGIRTRVEAALADCSRPPEILNNTNVTGWRDVGARQRPQAVWALGSLFRQPCQLLLHQVAIDAFALHQHLRRTVFADPARLQTRRSGRPRACVGILRA
jgi:hypothetical protein